jgi:hypothetical protein
MTQASETELAQGNIDVWFNWLRAGLMAFVRDDPVPVRFRSFSPFVVDPESSNPASDIVQQIRTVRVERSGVVEAAAVEALRNWSLSSDGWQAGVLLVSVVGRLGGRGVADAVWGLVARSGDLPDDARAELAYVAVEVAKLRYKYSEVVSLTELLWAEELATPQLISSIAVLLSRKDHGGLRMMPNKLAQIMPALVEPPHSGDFVRVISAALRQNYGIEDLTVALRPIYDEDLKAADFRRVLFSLSVPGSPPDNVISFPIKTSSLAQHHLSGMAALSNSDELSDLPFPSNSPSANSDGSDRL